jgi:hypothetical protein
VALPRGLLTPDSLGPESPPDRPVALTDRRLVVVVVMMMMMMRQLTNDRGRYIEVDQETVAGTSVTGRYFGT